MESTTANWMYLYVGAGVRVSPVRSGSTSCAGRVAIITSKSMIKRDYAMKNNPVQADIRLIANRKYQPPPSRVLAWRGHDSLPLRLIRKCLHFRVSSRLG